MNLSIKFLGIAFAIGAWASLSLADDQPNIPAKQWEVRPEGVSVALVLTARLENNKDEDVIDIYVKNTSNVKKYYMIATGDLGFKIFFLNDKGEWQSLRDYDGVTTMKTSGKIQAGQTICYPITLTSTEASLIKSHSVSCHIYVGDQSHRYFIQTRPQILTEMPESRSAH